MKPTTKTQPNKYNVGQRIPNGRVSQVQHSVYYYMNLANSRGVSLEELDKSFITWFKMDKDWLDKPVYVVNFKTPVKVLSLSEFLDANKYLTSDPDLQKEAYEKLVESKSQMMLPEIAIVPIDEDEEEPKEIQKILEFQED